MSSGQIERDFDAVSDVLTRKRDSTDPTYFQAQSTACVNFPWIPVAEEMSVTVMSTKTVESPLPAHGFGVPDIYVEEGQKEEEADRLFVHSDGVCTYVYMKYIYTYAYTYTYIYVYVYNMCTICLYGYIYNNYIYI